MRLALDSNILVYAEGVNGPDHQASALRILKMLPGYEIFVPVQILSEVFNVLTRKAGYSTSRAREAVLGWRYSFHHIETTEAVLLRGMDLVVDHRLGLWGSLVVAAAAEAACVLLLTEDMQDGFLWGGVTIANPFAKTLHPMLAGILRS